MEFAATMKQFLQVAEMCSTRSAKATKNTIAKKAARAREKEALKQAAAKEHAHKNAHTPKRIAAQDADQWVTEREAEVRNRAVAQTAPRASQLSQASTKRASAKVAALVKGSSAPENRIEQKRGDLVLTPRSARKHKARADEVFDVMDTNQDGVIDRAEFAAAFRGKQAAATYLC